MLNCFCIIQECPPWYGKIESKNKAKCPGDGICCGAGYRKNCGEQCAKNLCTGAGGTWVPVDHGKYPYTCEMG